MFSITRGKIRQFSEINKQVRKLPAVVSNSVDLVVGVVTCCCVPGPLAFLVNVEKLGVAWGQGYTTQQYGHVAQLRLAIFVPCDTLS